MEEAGGAGGEAAAAAEGVGRDQPPRAAGAAGGCDSAVQAKVAALLKRLPLPMARGGEDWAKGARGGGCDCAMAALGGATEAEKAELAAAGGAAWRRFLVTLRWEAEVRPEDSMVSEGAGPVAQGRGSGKDGWYTEARVGKASFLTYFIREEEARGRLRGINEALLKNPSRDFMRGRHGTAIPQPASNAAVNASAVVPRLSAIHGLIHLQQPFQVLHGKFAGAAQPRGTDGIRNGKGRCRVNFPSHSRKRLGVLETLQSPHIHELIKGHAVKLLHFDLPCRLLGVQ